MPTNCLSVFDHFVGLALKGLKFRFQYQPILTKCSVSIPPENVRKPLVSDVFRGYRNLALG